MASDPFPNTAEPTLEMRLQELFKGTSAIVVSATDPIDLKSGHLWFNTTTEELKLFSGGVIWVIGKGSVQN